MIQKLLKLSTAHIPSETADWQDACVRRHDYGWILWVAEYSASDYGPPVPGDIRLPAWLQPVMSHAYRNGCVLVLFDCDTKTRQDLPAWNWGTP